MEIKNIPNLVHSMPINQPTLNNFVAQPVRDINNTELANKISIKLDPLVMKQGSPALVQPPSQLNRTYEISEDPPSTVMKFTDPQTKEVVMQIPSEASIQAYRGIQEFLKKQDEINKAAIKIAV